MAADRVVYFILNGKRPEACADVLRWGKWFENSAGSRCVARTEVGPHIFVSTVFLGLDHNYGDGPPLLFETMAFGPEEERSYMLKGELRSYRCNPELSMDRYTTWEEAERGHARIVEEMRKRDAATEKQARALFASLKTK